MLEWKIGDVKITCIVEKIEPVRVHKLLAHATQEAFDAVGWISPFVDEKGRIKLSVHALVVELGEKRIVIDTCMGNDKHRLRHGGDLQTDFLERFEAAGFRRDEIDTVLCTHLHYDHVGWNTMLVDGKWIPTFPKARYLIGREEFEHAKDDEEGDHPFVFADSVKPVFEAGLVDLVETDHQLCEEISFVPTPGHTRGHVSVRISSKGESALITGDMVHHPVQLAHPEWFNNSDENPDQSTDTRRRIFGDAADARTLLIGSHFADPTAGHVIREGDAFRLTVPETVR